MTSIPSLLRRAWAFYRKQPVLTDILLWLIAVPLTIADLLILAAERLPLPPEFAVGGSAAFPVLLALVIGVILVQLWADASTLLVGKRLLSTAAGRSRTSFRAVARQSRGFVLPLLLTELLWFSSSALLGLLLILPGVIYAARTVFFPVVVVAEGKAYRAALRRSAEIVRGRTVEVLCTVIVLWLVCLFPAIMLGVIADDVASGRGWLLQILASAFGNTVLGLGGILYQLSTVNLYGKLKREAGRR